MTNTITDTTTFTATDAKHLAAKFATDLKRMQRFYGHPSDADIAMYEVEVIELLKKGYLGVLTCGFRRDGKWIRPTVRYTARDLMESAATDDDPGGIQPGADVTGASFHNYLTYSAAWDILSASDKETFKKTLPFQRVGATEPGVNGYFHPDRSYSSGGRTLSRASVKSFP